MTAMRTQDECLAMAAAMERRAQAYGLAGHGAAFLALAKSWRGLAGQARRQDACR